MLLQLQNYIQAVKQNKNMQKNLCNIFIKNDITPYIAEHVNAEFHSDQIMSINQSVDFLKWPKWCNHCKNQVDDVISR